MKPGEFELREVFDYLRKLHEQGYLSTIERDMVHLQLREACIKILRQEDEPIRLLESLDPPTESEKQLVELMDGERAIESLGEEAAHVS